MGESMKSIAFVIPFFGKFPKGFDLYLQSCGFNSTIDWIIFTDDRTTYNYPDNVKVNYCSFEDVCKRIREKFDFEVNLDRPYRLCEFKPTWGEVFANELKEYDFWGHCDIDLLWGDIRKFITDDILDKYEKIGNQGHATLYRNTKEVNARYRYIPQNAPGYIESFSAKTPRAFDEWPMEMIYKELKIPYYMETIYAHLTKYEHNFHLGHLPKKDEYKNKRQVFTLSNGILLRHYLEKNGELATQEFMYIHFWCRPMVYKTAATEQASYLIWSDCVDKQKHPVTVGQVNWLGRKHPIQFYAKSLWFNRHKLTWKRIIFNVRESIKRRMRSK